MQKKRNKKINHNKARVLNDYRELRLIINDNIFLSSLKQSLKNPYVRNNFLPNKKIFKNRLVDERMYFEDNEFSNDLRFISELLLNMAGELSLFSSIRINVEENILHGDYENALFLVEKVKEHFGYSYWYLENKFSLLSRLEREEDIYVHLRELKESFSEYETREATLLMEKSLLKKSTSRFEFMIQSILDSVDEDSIDFDAISFLFKFDINQKYNYGYIFRFILHLNVVDIYNCYIRIASHSLINGMEFSEYCVFTLASMRDGLNDPIIDNLILYNSGYYDKESFYHIMCEDYISGNFNEVIDSFERMECRLSFKVVFIELYVKSLIYLEREPRRTSSGVFDELVDFAYQITLSFDDSKLAYFDGVICQFTQSNYAYAINILKSKVTKSSREEIDKEYRFIDSIINYNNPFRPDVYIEYSICSGYRGRNLEALKSRVPEYRFNKWKGDELFDDGKYEEALKLFENITDVPTYLKMEIFEKKILIHHQLDNVNAVVNTIVDLYISESITIKRLPLYEIKENVFRSKKLDRKSINTPIFSHVMKIMGLCNEQKVALLCDDYLYLNGYSNAESILNICERTEFLFSTVMTIEVIKRQELKNLNLDDFINRVLLLLKIKERTSDKKSLDNDIEYLISQYSRKLAKHELGKGKININVDAIKLIAKNNYEDEFSDLLDENLEIESLNNPEFSTGYLKVEEFSLKIRDLYATHDVYGLDNTLNTDIRHNGIVPTLRAVFEANGVICTKKSDQYLDNSEYENSSKNSLRPHAYRFYQDKIIDFSARIDQIINGLKNKYLHVFTNDLDDREKLFKLTFTRQEISGVVGFINSTADLDLAIDYVLEILHNKTSQAMKIGAVTLNVATKERVNKCISDLIGSLGKNAKVNARFIESLKHTKNQFEHVIFDVSEWLNFINKSADDFSLMLPIQEALEFVKETHPYINILIHYDNKNKLNDYSYNGEYLATFIRVFLILFQNAAKSINRGGVSNIKVGYALNDSKATLSVSNNYDFIDIGLINKIKDSLKPKEILEGASRGSGSGLFKVKKIFSHELKIENSLDINVDEKNKQYFISITYDLAKIQTAEAGKDEVSDN